MLIHSQIKMKHKRGLAPFLSSVLKFHIHLKEEFNRIRQAGVLWIHPHLKAFLAAVFENTSLQHCSLAKRVLGNFMN